MMRLCVLLLAATAAAAADWPMYRGDAARSGFTAETIPNQLRQRWEFRLPASPRPAWPSAADRMEYDLGIQPILVGDLVIFASSADDQVYALDAKTRRIKWRYFTEGPVRLAPTAWKDRLFLASDDGYLHALTLRRGRCSGSIAPVPQPSECWAMSA